MHMISAQKRVLTSDSRVLAQITNTDSLKAPVSKSLLGVQYTSASVKASYYTFLCEFSMVGLFEVHETAG